MERFAPLLGEMIGSGLGACELLATIRRDNPRTSSIVTARRIQEVTGVITRVINAPGYKRARARRPGAINNRGVLDRCARVAAVGGMGACCIREGSRGLFSVSVLWTIVPRGVISVMGRINLAVCVSFFVGAPVLFYTAIIRPVTPLAVHARFWGQNTWNSYGIVF